MHTCRRWKNALVLMVNSNGMTYIIVVSVPADNIIDIYTHTSPLISQVTHMHLTLRGQCCIRYENVFTSSKCIHKTFLGPHALGVRS
jgi:hypothetical protein